jgi:hypothetical protein
MSKTKSYNQIIFITTLSVYLGLVLVGASPQVLAQAAITNRFELKDQIEQKDDLDKKPDDEIEAYSKNVKELYEITLDFIKKYDEQYELGGVYYLESSILFRSGNPLYSRMTIKSHRGFGSSVHHNSLIKISGLIPHTKDKEKKEHTNVKFNLNNDFYSIETTYHQDSDDMAKQVFTIYESEFSRYNIQKTESFEKLVYENTSLSFKNNQVFIVTRLPRGSIDSLLK